MGLGECVAELPRRASLERLAIVVETFGLPTPYLERSDSRALTESENLEALELLEAVGTGKPAIIRARSGLWNIAPYHRDLPRCMHRCWRSSAANRVKISSLRRCYKLKIRG